MSTYMNLTQATNPYVKHFNYLSHTSSSWVSSTERPGFQIRDLGLRGATRGAMVAELVRSSGSSDGSWQVRARRFDWLYVTSGSLELAVNGDVQRIDLKAKDAVLFAPHTPVRFLNASSDYEALELYEVDRAALSVDAPRAKRERTAAPFIEHDAKEKRIPGGGIRPYFSYRNFETSERTQGGVHIQEITMDEVVPLGTGFHIHTCGQFAYVLSGEAQVHMEQQTPIDLRAGDGICIAPGVAHNFLNYSLDYSVIEVTTPAKYDTVPVTIVPRIPLVVKEADAGAARA